MWPPAGTKDESTAQLAYMPDDTNKVDSALSSALIRSKHKHNHHQQTTVKNNMQ